MIARVGTGLRLKVGSRVKTGPKTLEIIKSSVLKALLTCAMTPLGVESISGSLKIAELCKRSL